MKFLKRFPLGVSIALVSQYILGMYVNMYVNLPTGGDAAADWDFAHTSWQLMSHVVLGMLIALGTLAYLIVVLVKKQRQLLWYAIIGFVSTLAAAVGGERFMATQNDGWSMVMAIGFVGAIVTYLLALRVTPQK